MKLALGLSFRLPIRLPHSWSKQTSDTGDVLVVDYIRVKEESLQNCKLESLGLAFMRWWQAACEYDHYRIYFTDNSVGRKADGLLMKVSDGNLKQRRALMCTEPAAGIQKWTIKTGLTMFSPAHISLHHEYIKKVQLCIIYSTPTIFFYCTVMQFL